jgi:RHS repeat-associated protein
LADPFSTVKLAPLSGTPAGGTITTAITWTQSDSPYVVQGGLTIADGGTLTIEPGVEVRFAPSGWFDVQSGGRLIAEGTLAQPITFTSDEPSPAAGDWYYLQIWGTARLSYCDLAYAGHNGYAAVQLFSSDVQLRHCRIHDNTSHGLYLDGAGLTPLLEDLEITANGGSAIQQTTLNMQPVYHNLTLAGNGADALVLPGGGLDRGVTLDDAGLNGRPIVSTGAIVVNEGTTLTITPGTELRLPPSGYLDVYAGGTLLAEGSPSRPITLTVNLPQPAAGDWYYLQLWGTARLSYCDLAYAGHNNYAAVQLFSSDVQLRHCRIHDNTADALYVENSQPTLAYNQLYSNTFGLRNATPAIMVDARENWWGDPSGPYHPVLNPGGKGNGVSDGVAFAPWIEGYTWLDTEDGLFHGVEQLSWAAFGVDSRTQTTDIAASGAGRGSMIAPPLPARGQAANGSLAWNTHRVADGSYELRATFRDETGRIAGTAVRTVLVNNSPVISWHAGRITTAETWGADQIHLVERDVTIAAGVTVTVQPGAVVKFAPGTQITIQAGGGLRAPATKEQPIIFTSLADDTGGDTNLDGSQTFPRAGDWRGISTQGVGQLVLGDYVELRYLTVAHSGALAGDETWAGAFMHEVTGDVIVPAGATLTIEAGAVVKFDHHLGIVIQPGGRLIALGSAAQPIWMTSLRDDSVGGDTNGDGDQTAPAPGDWRWIYVDSAEAVLDHVILVYGGGTVSGQWDQTGVLRTAGSARVVVANSTIRDAFFDGVLAWGGPVTITNSVLTGMDRAICAHPGSTVQVINCTVDRNRIGLLVHGGAMAVSNTIVSNSFTAGVLHDYGPDSLTVRYSDVWNPTAAQGNYNGTADQTGQNGNLSVDPHFRSAEGGSYQLAYGSPLIDAADGTVAPASDAMGAPRYDDPRTANTGLPTPAGAFADMGAFEFVETADSDLDLVVVQVEGPLLAVAGDKATVSWTVTNIGSAQALGPWHDTISLVYSPEANPVVIPAGEVLVGEGVTLGPGQSYLASAEIRVPGGVAADYSWQVETNTQGDVFEGRNRGNNTRLALGTVALDVPELTIGGAPLSGRFTAPGEAQWFKFDLAAGQDVLVSLDLADDAGVTELYLAQGRMPTRQDYDARHTQSAAPDVSALATGAGQQSYYVLAYAQSLPGGASDFTIAARAISYALEAVTPSEVGNSGPVTLQLQGGQLGEDMTYELIDPAGAAHAARAVFLVNSAQVYATFDLTGLPIGRYGVRVSDGPRTTALDGALNVIAGEPGRVEVHLSAPNALRPDWTGLVVVDYANVGTTDVPAPLMLLAAQNANLALGGPTGFVGPQVQLLGIHAEGPAGILPPGAKGSITLQVLPVAGSSEVTFQLTLLADPGAQLDWAAMKNGLRPELVPTDDWEAIYANLAARLGSTAGQYQARLAQDATYLSRLGEYTCDAQRLLAFELNQSGLNEISQRYALGPFGRGITPWWQIQALTDSEGDVVVGVGMQQRFFRRQADGSYQGMVGDLATLSIVSGTYRLRETNGLTTVFRSDGKLDAIEEPGGNRIAAGYSGDQLNTLTDSSGDVFSYSYNTQGRITQLTDPVGRVTIYSYDPSGEHLLSVGGPPGTFSLTYLSGQGAAVEHALSSVAFPDGTHLFYEYDVYGRLARTYGDGQAEATSYAYGPAGEVTVTDATGSRQTFLLDDRGQLVRTTDSLSNTAGYIPDENGWPVRLTKPDGTTFSFHYDAQGNLAGLVDPLGGQLNMGYDPSFNQLSSLTNAAGNSLHLDYDRKGNLAQIAYPDGRSESWSYDEAGRLAAWTNGRGQTTRYTYDAHGLLLRQEPAGGSPWEFSYDAHRNLVAATGGGKTTTLAYDDADHLTRVTYPSGLFLEFTYDAGGRRTRSVDQDGLAVNYGYDAFGRLVSLTDQNNVALVAYTYDAVGRLQRKDLGNGVSTTYTYNSANQLLSLTNQRADGVVLSRFDYTYDRLGRRTQVGTLEGQWSYVHDAVGQLTQATFASNDPAVPNQDLTYMYDAAGNRVRTIENGGATVYTANNADQYVSAGAVNYTYDRDGNLVSRQDGAGEWVYTYDSENQLVSVAGPDGDWSYEYDPFGNRIAATHDGQRSEYVVDPLLGNLVGVYDGAGRPIARYVHGLGLTSRVDSAGESAYYSFDAQGSTSELIDQAGNVLNQYVYLPFGGRLAGKESVDNPFQYVGELGVMQDGSGLQYMRARYYDPATGRFTQPDPVGIAGGVGLYAYVGNDPVNLVDPLGWGPWPPGWDLWDKIKHLNDISAEWLWRQQQQWLRDRLNPQAPGTLRLILEAFKEMARNGLAYVRPVAAQAWVLVLPYAASAWQWVLASPPVLQGTLALGAGAVIGTGARYVPYLGTGLDWIAQKSWLGVNWVTGGWLFGPSPNATASTSIVSSHDPNDLLGPAGPGDEHWLAATQNLPYTIRFENDAKATAPAQVVSITQRLDAGLDLATFRWIGFGFGDVAETVPAGLDPAVYSRQLLISDTLTVEVSATLDTAAGLLTWEFRSIDPVTGRAPEDPLAGFLPPNNKEWCGSDPPRCGEGFISYVVEPRSALGTGTAIKAQARIVFDNNEPIDTPVYLNTMDADPPTSTVSSLPATVEAADLEVKWAGSDAAGSGIAFYDLYVSQDGGPFAPWRAGITTTSALFDGELGHTYAFYSVATDRTGNRHTPPGTAQASTTTRAARSFPWLWLVVGLGGVLAVGAVVVVILQRRGRRRRQGSG